MENITANAPIAYKYGNNFDPNSVDAERVVLLSLVVDCSPSIRIFEDDFTRALREYIEKEKSRHIAEEIMVQLVTFAGDVRFETGFQPLLSIDPTTISIKNRGQSTAGYDAMKEALDSIISYGEQLERCNTDVRYTVVLVTDGEFNDGKDDDGRTVRVILDKINNVNNPMSEKKSKFSIFMYGVGNEPTFKAAQANMGLKPHALLTYGATGNDFDKMMDNVSASVSKSSSGTAVPTF